VSRQGREVVVIEAVRTAVGRGHPEKGAYRSVHPQDLLGACFTEVLRRADVDAVEVDGVLSGCVQQLGEQAWNIGRHAWLSEGLPYEASAITVDAQCGSGQQAINLAASAIASGMHDVVVAGGVEHMGHVSFADGQRAQDEFGSAFPPKLRERQGFVEKHNMVGQGNAAEQIAADWNVSREELDQLALRSHQLAAKASDEGRFEREILPIETDEGTVVADQGIRRDTSMERLASLPPAFKEDGKITAATSSQISDGAAAVLLMSGERAAALGLAPRARVLDQVFIGSEPKLMLTGPIPATRKVLERNGLTIDDIGAIEINEAFASVVAAWLSELEPELDRVNPRGGAMALGHPLGSTGARLVTTLLHEMEDEDLELGLVTMCCGGGLGTGTLLQRLDRADGR
jgi:acetyl-CoA acyltransferase